MKSVEPVVGSQSPASMRFGLGWSLLIAMGSLLLTLRFAFLDFDAHHDGLLATAAVALRDGNTVHSEVFAQYGPVTPWIQASAP